MAENDVMLMGIAGGSASGKSTLAKELKHRFGDLVSVVSQDDYYKDNHDKPKEVLDNMNFDAPDAIDFDMLVDQMRQLKSGKAIEQPVYDYTISGRTGETRHIEPAKVLILEGHLILNDERLRDMMDTKVFVERDEGRRLEHRMERDARERGRSREQTIKQFYDSVKPMHDKYVEPSKQYADIIVNNNVQNDYGRVNDVACDMISDSVEKYLIEQGVDVPQAKHVWETPGTPDGGSEKDASENAAPKAPRKLADFDGPDDDSATDDLSMSGFD